MTLSEIAQKACGMVNLKDSWSIERALQYARDRWQTIWNAHLWKDSVGYVSAEPEMDGSRCIMRVPLERVRNIRVGDYNIAPVDPSNVFQLDAKAFDDFGDIVAFTELGKDENNMRIVQLYRVPRELDGSAYLVMGKKYCPEIGDDEQPPLTGVDDCLWEMTLGDVWRMDQQFSKAASCYQNGGTFLENMRKIDGEQSATNIRILPENSYDWTGREVLG
jgi:hypothetical protein